MKNINYIQNKRYRLHFQLRKKGFKVNTHARNIEVTEKTKDDPFLKKHFDFLRQKNYTIQITLGL